MTLKSTAIALSLLAGSFGLAAAPGPAAALTPDQEATYKEMHMAIRAAEECRFMSFGQADHDRFSAIIQQAVGAPVGPNQLKMVHDASWDGFNLVRHKGCNNPDVASLLQTFDQTLAVQ